MGPPAGDGGAGVLVPTAGCVVVLASEPSPELAVLVGLMTPELRTGVLVGFWTGVVELWPKFESAVVRVSPNTLASLLLGLFPGELTALLRLVL